MTGRVARPGPRGSVALLPAAPGVYRFRDEGGIVMYVGRAVDLRRRVFSYWTHLGDRPRLARMVARIAAVEAVPCDSGHEAAWLERNLLETAKPRYNRVRGGAEAAGYLRLDLRERTGGVSYVHTAEPIDGTTTFGPYLSGTQIRLAAAALNRLCPLRYTSRGLVGAARDMAAARRVTEADRDEFVARMVSVLEREPAAVATARNHLARLRDEASANDAFEVAASVQNELEGLTWVVSEQKVTRPEPIDADLYGWAGDVLVGLELRGGRIRRWTQKPCSEPAANALVCRTPPQWLPFVQRAASLAGALAGHPS